LDEALVMSFEDRGKKGEDRGQRTEDSGVRKGQDLTPGAKAAKRHFTHEESLTRVAGGFHAETQRGEAATKRFQAGMERGFARASRDNRDTEKWRRKKGNRHGILTADFADERRWKRHEF